MLYLHMHLQYTMYHGDNNDRDDNFTLKWHHMNMSDHCETQHCITPHIMILLYWLYYVYKTR